MFSKNLSYCYRRLIICFLHDAPHETLEGVALLDGVPVGTHGVQIVLRGNMLMLLLRWGMIRFLQMSTQESKMCSVVGTKRKQRGEAQSGGATYPCLPFLVSSYSGRKPLTAEELLLLARERRIVPLGWPCMFRS